MKKLFAIAITTVVAGCVVYIYSQPLPSSFSTVTIDNITNKLWEENISLFMITSDNAFTLIQTPYQKIISSKHNNNRYAIICVTGTNKEYQEKPSQNDLKDTRLLQLNNPIILQNAKRITGKNTIEEAEQLVYHTIETKTEGIPIIPAPSIFEIKKGDCTEHAIATIALLRALHIPARAVVGMIAVKEYAGKKNVFVFHMWAEAFYNNKWILVDATRPGKKKTNCYIALSHHSLETEMPLNFLESMAQIQNLKVTYLSE
ncbi:MAG: transglutaminase domain-containing protein [Spirochaetes bacterium]|nr:transglutaminase domain-containing protein [Spirochaetota bacterium]